MLTRYRNGKSIVEKQEEEGWGSQIIEKLLEICKRYSRILKNQCIQNEVILSILCKNPTSCGILKQSPNRKIPGGTIIFCLPVSYQHKFDQDN